MKRSRVFLLTVSMWACSLSFAADPLQHELLVFGSGELATTSGAELPTDIDDVRIAADVLFSVERGGLKIFGEYLLANHEQDLERLQIGWEPNEQITLWFGRFHQASSVWNHQHHHGQFLQTSITRPATEDWEDDGGVIPQHFVGLLAESNWRVGRHSGLRTALGGGIAPVLTSDGLEPLDLLSPNLRRHKLGFQARIAWFPDELEDTGVGVLFAHNEIAWRGSSDVPAPLGFDHFDQSVVGVYGNLETGSWKMRAAAYRVQAGVDVANETGGVNNFVTGYVQLERALPQGVEAFIRHEDSAAAGSAVYLTLFPHFVAQRSSIGARWQFARNHALSLQADDTHTLSDHYREFRLQWSAALL